MRAVVHLTGFAESSAKHCFLSLNLTMNECTSSDLKLQLWSHQSSIRNTVLPLYVEFLVISRGAGACQVQILTGHVCLQDAVPPELVHVLQNSKDPLLQKLFPVTEKNQNSTKTQNRAAVVTVVSKFKVHPIQVSAVILETSRIYHQQFDEMHPQSGFFAQEKCSNTKSVEPSLPRAASWGGWEIPEEEEEPC